MYTYIYIVIYVYMYVSISMYIISVSATTMTTLSLYPVNMRAKNYRSLLQKSPIKETIFYIRDL